MAHHIPATEVPARKTRLWAHLYFQIIVAIVAGIAAGLIWPEFGAQLEWIAKGFVKLVKMIIAPVIFLTIVTGIGGLSKVSEVGRVAGKAMGYFLAVSSFALLVGLVVANVVQPGTTVIAS